MYVCKLPWKSNHYDLDTQRTRVLPFNTESLAVLIASANLHEGRGQCVSSPWRHRGDRPAPDSSKPCHAHTGSHFGCKGTAARTEQEEGVWEEWKGDEQEK